MLFPNLVAPKAILFDWDNTIVNSQFKITSTLTQALRLFGKPELPLRFRSHKLMEEHLKDLFGEQDWKSALQVYRGYADDEKNFALMTLNEGVVNLLSYIKDLGIMAAIVSNRRGPILRKEVNYFKLTDYFEKIVGAGDAKSDKPSAEPVYLALSESGLGVDKDPIWLIGDSTTDIECAKNSGCTPLLYKNSEIGIPFYQSFDDIKQALTQSLSLGRI